MAFVPHAVAQVQLAPQIPLTDAPYPNDNATAQNVSNTAHIYMILAYRAQLANNTEQYNIDVLTYILTMQWYVIMDYWAIIQLSCLHAIAQWSR